MTHALALLLIRVRCSIYLAPAISSPAVRLADTLDAMRRAG